MVDYVHFLYRSQIHFFFILFLFVELAEYSLFITGDPTLNYPLLEHMLYAMLLNMYVGTGF